MSPSPRLTPARAFVPFFVVSALELVARLFDLDAIATRDEDAWRDERAPFLLY